MIQVDKLIKKYNTNNPEKIAKELGIIVIYEPLGTINGYYCKSSRIKTIHINESLDDRAKTFTLAHELGHAVLHPNENTPFLVSHTYFSVNKLEIEANTFAVNLMISNQDLLDYHEYTIPQLATVFGLNEEIINLRIQSI